MKNYNAVVANRGFSTETSSISSCKVFEFEAYTPPQKAKPDGYKSISEIVDRWEKDESRREALKKARTRIKNKFYGEDGETVRTIRLSKGLSQEQLATLIGTSQPHIAKIERGTQNVLIDTCRRLCEVLGIDMNRLNEALTRQDELAREKGARDD